MSLSSPMEPPNSKPYTCTISVFLPNSISKVPKKRNVCKNNEIESFTSTYVKQFSHIYTCTHTDTHRLILKTP